ncbi:MAG: succinate dehydrogenase, cytochrome b556 subunit [Gammaproteobacteria bacterium]|nr:succinate dehydrogenase, cytochrome b556 subunit [Gammaproteobacteria bacterium]
MARADRPLSPHLGIYRWQVANGLSILHRATGVFLSLGTLVLIGWLIAVASGYQAYVRVNDWLMGPLGALLLLGWTFSFFYHLCNGIRHLGWDIGLGFDKERARMTGWLTVVVSVVLTLGFWATALAGGGA